MSYNNENEAISMACHLGSISSALTVPLVHFPKKVKLVSAKLLNGASIPADNGNYVTLQVKSGSTVVAQLDTRAAHQGAVTANVSKELELLVSSLDALTDLTGVYAENEGVKEITRIVCVVGTALDQKGFLISDDTDRVGVWFDTDSSGTEPTGLAAADSRTIKISTVAGGDTAAQVATKLAAALDADAKFVAIVDPNDSTAVIVTDASVGARTDAADGLTTEATGFTISVDQQGVDVVAKALTNAKLMLDYFPL